MAVWWLQGAAVFAQSTSNGELKLDTGKEIYLAGCAGCHGPDGKGMPKTTLGFEPPSSFPDFSDCNGSVRERNFDWRATIHEGGAAGRGWSDIMPSFSEALTRDQIDKVMGYLRTFCSEPAWPRGELNLPRAIATEKAFPEDETVITTEINANGTPGVSNELAYERRFGAKNQLEFSFPFAFQQAPATGTWFGGVGDLGLGLKRVLFHKLNENSGSILSVQGGIHVPTGNRDHDLGSGVTTFETFASFGQLLPKMAFVQEQVGADLPKDTSRAPQSLFWHTAVGKTFAQKGGYGRIWTPMLELLGDRDLVDGSRMNWDLLPEFQVSLSRRQHIMADIGVRFPVNNTVGRTTTVVFYLLWDWFDGGLREGWK